MKKLLLVFVLAGTFSANAKNNQPVNEVKVSPKTIIVKQSDEEACRICVTIMIKGPTGAIIGMTTCAGNMFTDCETAHKLAATKLAKKTLDILSSAGNGSLN